MLLIKSKVEVVTLVVCPTFSAIEAYLINIDKSSIVNGVSKPIWHSLFTLEFDEYVFLHARLKQVDVDNASDELSIRIAVLIRQYCDVATIIRLELTSDLFEELLKVRLFYVSRSLKVLRLNTIVLT